MKEVPEDSDDAKKWPRWIGDSPAQSGLSPTVTTSNNLTNNDLSHPSNPSSPSDPSSSLTAPSFTPQARLKPGPRKSKVNLSALLASSSQKPKKLSTLEKSALDWNTHVSSGDANAQAALAANRKGGGYLEKVEFLQRVEERKGDVVEATKGKRRRG